MITSSIIGTEITYYYPDLVGGFFFISMLFCASMIFLILRIEENKELKKENQDFRDFIKIKNAVQ